MIKKLAIGILFFLLFINLYGNDIFIFKYKENILLDRGYIKYDPDKRFIERVFEDVYFEIFKIDPLLDHTYKGKISMNWNIGDGFKYILYHIIEKENLPNILTAAWFEYNGEYYGYYKPNFNLEGNLRLTVFGIYLVFF